MRLVGDKLVVCQSRWRGQVVDEHGVFFGAGIDVDVQVARLSVEPDFSGGVCCPAEHFVPEILDVITQNVISIDVEIETHVGEVGMLEHTVDYGIVFVFAGRALPVVNHGITEINVVRAQDDGIVDEAVVHFGCVDFHSSFAD